MSTEPKSKTYQLDIFDVLDKINTNDFGYYDRLTQVQQKSVQPFVLMKWMVGTKNDKQLVRLNNIVNPYAFSLGNDHKELLFKLLCSVTAGRSQRYSWSKSGKKSASMSNVVKVIQEYWGYNQRHARDAIVLLSDDQILDIAQFLGRQSDELTKIKAELKTRSKNG